MYSRGLSQSYRHVSQPLMHHLGRRLVSTSSNVKPYYLTTPIFYPNSDIFARYSRYLRPDRPVHFMTGTDEHGLKIQKAAQARGLDPLAFCDELSEHFRALVEKANVSATQFSRTSSSSHCDAVQYLWRQLEARGLIYKGSHSGWYSVSDECFYPPLQVSKQISPGSGEEYHVSVETGSRVEWTEEVNYKFRLSPFKSVLQAHYEAQEYSIYPPQYRSDILLALSEHQDLDDLSVSRPRSRLTWGVPVPGDDDHTIYVWIDALMVYLTSIGYPWSNGRSRFQSGWPPNLQIIGKDILRFHAIYLPAMLSALDLPFAETLLVHAHWTVNGQKMSKSIGNVADPIAAIDEFGVDIVRWYLARVGGNFRDDTDWSNSQLQKHAREITSLLGNLYSRMTSSKIQGLVDGHDRPSLMQMLDDNTRQCLLLLQRLPDDVHRSMEKMQLSPALDSLVSVLEAANALVTTTRPWAETQSTPAVRAMYWTVLECLRTCGILLQPIVPSRATLLLDCLGVPPEERTHDYASVKARGQMGTPVPGVLLFPNVGKAGRDVEGPKTNRQPSP